MNEKIELRGMRGKCSLCPATWGPMTSVAGWKMDTETNLWVTCPDCLKLDPLEVEKRMDSEQAAKTDAEYRDDIRKLRRRDRATYLEWLACNCGAFNKSVTRTRDHDIKCLARASGKNRKQA